MTVTKSLSPLVPALRWLGAAAFACFFMWLALALSSARAAPLEQPELEQPELERPQLKEQDQGDLCHLPSGEPIDCDELCHLPTGQPLPCAEICEGPRGEPQPCAP